MRLINVKTYEIREFTGVDIPPYAILSHTWEAEEVSFQDMSNLDAARIKKGFTKIEYCCRQAGENGWAWCWVDTCCIDKTSSAELSEAINSMFQYYRRSMVCYAYISDLPDNTSSVSMFLDRQDYVKSPRSRPRWFTRGWTLQELLAPLVVRFYDREWNLIGTKDTLRRELYDLTGIPMDILDNSTDLSKVPVARRMYWATDRSTTRVEDMAYCLLGLFDVHMPLLYGEGLAAFQRLQEHIIRTTDDDSLFLWGMRSSMLGQDRIDIQLTGMLASTPWLFRHDLPEVQVSSVRTPPPQMTSRGLQIRLPIKQLESVESYPPLHRLFTSVLDDRLKRLLGTFSVYLAALDCTTPSQGEQRAVVIILLRDPGRNDFRFHRLGGVYDRVPVAEARTWGIHECYIQQHESPLLNSPLGNEIDQESAWRGLSIAASNQTSGYSLHQKRFFADQSCCIVVFKHPASWITDITVICGFGDEVWFHVDGKETVVAQDTWTPYMTRRPDEALSAKKRSGTGPVFSGSWDIYKYYSWDINKLCVNLTLYQKDFASGYRKLTLWWAITKMKKAEIV
jgi:hypothetical protein